MSNVNNYVMCQFNSMSTKFIAVVLQMESSGKWPTELDAISHIKASFYTYLSRVLSDQYNLLCSPTLSHLDVLKVIRYLPF